MAAVARVLGKLFAGNRAAGAGDGKFRKTRLERSDAERPGDALRRGRRAGKLDSELVVLRADVRSARLRRPRHSARCAARDIVVHFKQNMDSDEGLKVIEDMEIEDTVTSCCSGSPDVVALSLPEHRREIVTSATKRIAQSNSHEINGMFSESGARKNDILIYRNYSDKSSVALLVRLIHDLRTRLAGFLYR